jgi:hypothetical protein
MNSAHQVQTLEITDADLDTISGGLSPEVSLTVDSTTLSSAGLASQLDAVKGEALGTVGESHQLGFNAAF